MKTDYRTTNEIKILRILREHDFVYFLKRLSYRLFFQPLIYAIASKTFVFHGKKHRYFRHSYNTTFINERTVEIPVFVERIKSMAPDQILEIGNVLSHYMDAKWTVIDKYEKAPGVQNVDIESYTPTKKYDLIIAISTFEHIGYDEMPKDPTKLERVILHLKTNCLTDSGRILFSVPIGWNSELDQHLKNGKFECEELICMQRLNWLNEWGEINAHDDWYRQKYKMFPGALAIVELKK